MTSDHWFPGRWTGGIALLLGPVLLLAATLLRAPFPFFFPHQLAAAGAHPALMTAAYTAFLAGNVVLCPAVLALARAIGQVRPALAAWGGGLVVTGLFARTFHAGVDHAAFGLVRHQGADRATALVADSYADPHLFSYLSFTILLGWLVLAVGAFRSRRLGLVRSVALASMVLLPLGVLKGTEPQSIVAVVGLCVAFLPEGIRLLRDGPRPSRRSVLLVVPAVVGLGALAYVSTLG